MLMDTVVYFYIFVLTFVLLRSFWKTDTIVPISKPYTSRMTLEEREKTLDAISKSHKQTVEKARELHRTFQPNMDNTDDDRT